MNPAELLEGMTLEGGWKVLRRINKKPNATGAHFSTGYLVQNEEDHEGFLKAMDYSEAFDHPDPRFVALLLNEKTDAYLFEKTLCEKCSDHSMRRVVHAIASGTVRVNPIDKYSIVEYLIFEMAQGDVRAQLDAHASFDLAFAVRTLHHVSVGLKQLHSRNIAHQDLKPSNIMVFPNERGAKVGDLGRSWSNDLSSPYDELRIAGDKTYAPPEFLYREIPSTTYRRRFGCDLYHLGSLAVFFFLRVHMNALLKEHLSPEHRFDKWGGTYADVLPYVQEAFANSMQEFSAKVPELVRGRLTEMVKQLCEPDPSKRGDPINRHSDQTQHSLERYVSLLDFLAFKAETFAKMR
jgi:eukaryotic-like serine/threonine-protein kinase